MLKDHFSCYYKLIPLGTTHVDVYRILRMFDVTDPSIAHAVKKLLAAGKRGEKDTAKDVAEAIASLERFQELQKEELASIDAQCRARLPLQTFSDDKGA